MKTPVRTLCFAALTFLAACTAVGERTKVSVGYYNVNGETFDELDQDIRLHGPNVTGVGKALASTDLRMVPKIKYARQRHGCKVSSARVNVNARVTLPRHTNEAGLRSELASAWQNLEEYAKIHEAVHLAIADRYALIMEEAILDLPGQNTCDVMRQQAKQTFSVLFQHHHEEQLAFDASEKQRIKQLIALR